MHMEIRWSSAKNDDLKRKFGFGFERVLVALAEGDLLDVREHPNKERHGHQRQFVLKIEDYAWIAPFVTDSDSAFLKTLFPSRKATADYLEPRK